MKIQTDRALVLTFPIFSPETFMSGPERGKNCKHTAQHSIIMNNNFSAASDNWAFADFRWQREMCFLSLCVYQAYLKQVYLRLSTQPFPQIDPRGKITSNTSDTTG